MHAECLSDAQVQHNLLASSGDGHRSDVSIQPLDLSALASSAVAQPAEDLARLARAELKGRGALRFEPGDGAAQLQHRFRLGHLRTLVDEVLEPVVRRLDLPCHVGELEPDDRVIDESLAECAALVCVLHGVFVADASVPDRLNDDSDSLVVEVRHDNYIHVSNRSRRRV